MESLFLQLLERYGLPLALVVVLIYWYVKVETPRREKETAEARAEVKAERDAAAQERERRTTLVAEQLELSRQEGAAARKIFAEELAATRRTHTQAVETITSAVKDLAERHERGLANVATKIKPPRPRTPKT